MLLQYCKIYGNENKATCCCCCCYVLALVPFNLNRNKLSFSLTHLGCKHRIHDILRLFTLKARSNKLFKMQYSD